MEIASNAQAADLRSEQRMLDGEDGTQAAADESAAQGEGLDGDTERCIRVLGIMEEECTDPAFLTKISDFASKHATSFDDREEDHPIQWMASWNEYRELVERCLEEVMRREGISPEELASFCEYIAEEDPQALVCVDYLLASVDYLAFVQLMLDHKQLLTSSPSPCTPAIQSTDE